MAKKKSKNQLPSGSYRIQVFDYTDLDGKKHYKSFTAPSKKVARQMALDWQNNRPENEPEDLTLYEAVERYLDVKRNVLSPSTLRGYEGMKENYFKNSLGRKKVRPDLYTPNDEDIKKLLDRIKGDELEIAVLLAAFGPLRRGEICALTDKDIHGNMIEVSKSMVQGPDKQWYIKQPKTYGSYRQVEFPDFVIEHLKGIEGRIIKATPAQITNRFARAIKYSKLPHFRFHDLRHYSASIMHAIGVPDQYILNRGGWTSDNVMKTVYRNVIDLESTKQNKKINRHFEKITKHV